MIIIDIETGDFDVESGIMEVAALAIENNIVKESIHLYKIYDESLISNGFGDGYEDISYNDDYIGKFKDFISKYNYPIVAHNANFDRKFLVYYEWLDSDYPVYDSMRAIKYENPYLFSYAMEYLLNYYNISTNQSHTAIGDAHDLLSIVTLIDPQTWIPVGKSKIYKKEYKSKKLDISIDDSEIIGDAFKDKNLVFTGKGPYARKDLSLLAMKYGATVLNGVNKKTDILVVGEDAGQKLQKATDLGIEILSIDDFMDITSNTSIESYSKRTNTTIKPRKSNKLEFNLNEKYFEGDIISLIPMRMKMAEKISTIIEDLGGNPITSFRQKETKLLIYETYGEDFVTVNKAKDKNIKTITLPEFNRLLVENKIGELVCEA